MKWIANTALFAAPAAALIAPAYATDYLTVQQAQAEFFPDTVLQPAPIKLSETQRDDMQRRSGVHEPFDEKGVWKAASGGWLVVDNVVGKHEKITYVVALDAHGVVKGIEILSYNESYGHEVRKAEWRAQFVGKTTADPLTLNKDIKNISGATLSSKHVTQGVKRVLALYDLVLKGSGT